MQIHRNALVQLGHSSDLPLKFIDSLQETAAPWGRELLAHNLNTVFTNPTPKVRYLLRSLGGELRGFSFRPLSTTRLTTHMLTFEVRFPRKRRVDAEVAEAAEMLGQSKEVLDAQLQKQLAETQQQYIQAVSDAELLMEYRDGLVPQSDAAYRAMLNAYAANREQFIHVLEYFTELLHLKLDFAKTLADHETALAHLESLTGANLR